MKYHLILTLDYELFGNGSGCLTHCVVLPAASCLQTLEKFNAKMEFFVDTTEFLALNRYQDVFGRGMAEVEQQLIAALESGHRLQLHLHPQWSEATYHEGTWDLAMSKWRIGDLGEREIQQCVDEGLAYLAELEQRSSCTSAENCRVFRAGGWAIQPAGKVLSVLISRGIEMESTVAPGAYNPSVGDWYDFRKSSRLPLWPIDTDVLKQTDDDAKSLIEIPITTANIGRLKHAKALKEHKSSATLPSGCAGTYDGPNSRFQDLKGKVSKLLRMGHVMLDFSTMPGWMLVDITKQYQKEFSAAEGPIPIVAIGHNKNFTERSNANLSYWMDWITEQNDIQFSSYAQWHSAYKTKYSSAQS